MFKFTVLYEINLVLFGPELKKTGNGTFAKKAIRRSRVEFH